MLREPLVKIRYGVGNWTSRAFDVWMYKWPRAGLVVRLDRPGHPARRVRAASPGKIPSGWSATGPPGSTAGRSSSQIVAPRATRRSQLLVPLAVAATPGLAGLPGGPPADAPAQPGAPIHQALDKQPAPLAAHDRRNPKVLVTGDPRPGRLVPGAAAAGRRPRRRGHHPPSRAAPAELWSTGSRVPLVPLDLADAAPDRGAGAPASRPTRSTTSPRGPPAPSCSTIRWPRPTSTASRSPALLEAIRRSNPQIRFCQASSAARSSPGASSAPRTRRTAVAPLNAYGAAKAFADHMVAAYRSTHGLFACSRRAVPAREPPPARRISWSARWPRPAARIGAGVSSSVTLGDLDAVRDWGYAPDYVDAMRRMLQARRARATTSSPAARAIPCARCARPHSATWAWTGGRTWSVDQGLKRAPERAARIGEPRPGPARARVGSRRVDFSPADHRAGRC